MCINYDICPFTAKWWKSKNINVELNPGEVIVNAITVIFHTLKLAGATLYGGEDSSKEWKPEVKFPSKRAANGLGLLLRGKLTAKWLKA
jgi:hypothetical protein